MHTLYILCKLKPHKNYNNYSSYGSFTYSILFCISYYIALENNKLKMYESRLVDKHGYTWLLYTANVY